MIQWPEAAFRSWFVAARSDLLRRNPLKVSVLGIPLVLARLKNGEILAAEDRCPHRSAPLSGGSVSVEGLVCAYHGWTFDAAGRCVSIPGLCAGVTPPGVGLRLVQSQEHDGFVWVKLSKQNGVDLPAEIRSLNSESNRFIWQDRWACGVADAIENMLDPLHTHFVHAGWVRRDAKRCPVQVNIEERESSVVANYHGQTTQSGWLFRLFESSRSVERAYLHLPSSVQLEYRYRNGSAIWLCLHFTPEAPQQTHVFASLHVKGRWAPAWAIRWLVWPWMRRVAMQDKKLLEIQAKNREHFPRINEASTSLDYMRPYIDDFWQKNSGVPKERLVDIQILI